ncbi:hypothetical protein AAG570_003902 [Ranatra chinensis]|uniref:C2H2-type domain-containing protein n=1 Tax=Ranatra chinensis TaxID=642074 RepID=A0ABD0Y288_9HEMI
MYRPKVFGRVNVSISPEFLALSPPGMDKTIFLKDAAKKTGLTLLLNKSDVLFSGSFQEVTELHAWLSSCLDEWFNPPKIPGEGTNKTGDNFVTDPSDRHSISSESHLPGQNFLENRLYAVESVNVRPSPLVYGTEDPLIPHKEMSNQSSMNGTPYEADLDELDRLCKLLRLDESQLPLPGPVQPPAGSLRVPHVPPRSSSFFTPVHEGRYSGYTCCPFCPFKTEQLSHFIKHSMTHLKSLVETARRGCDGRTRDRLDRLYSLIPSYETEPSLPAFVKPPLPSGSLNQLVINNRTEQRKSVKYCPLCSFKTKRANRYRRHLMLHMKNPEMCKCKECGFRSMCKSSLRHHQLCHHDKNVDQSSHPSQTGNVLGKFIHAKCTNLAKNMLEDKLEEKRQHRRLKNMRVKVQCSQCTFESRSSSRLKRHEYKAHGMKRTSRLPSMCHSSTTSISGTSAWITATASPICDPTVPVMDTIDIPVTAAPPQIPSNSGFNTVQI